MTEREVAQRLLHYCRLLLRYDGLDKERVRQAIDGIDDTVYKWTILEQSGDLNDE